MRQNDMPQNRVARLRSEIAGCEVCVDSLPLGPRPVVQFAASSRIVIVGQAPGTKVHRSGVPWDDASGDNLRSWLRVSKETFYDPDRFAIVPMGFCYPGKATGGDAPPRPECAVTWHSQVFSIFNSDPLVLLCGLYAVRRYLPNTKKCTLTEVVRSFDDFGPKYFPLPHPSWRSRIWMQNNPWFEANVLPSLRAAVAGRLESVCDESTPRSGR